jgi:ABC-type antimicrobial peptide transport system ATPase subunit
MEHMLVETKARIGVFAIALGAYLPQFPTLVPEFEGQYREFKKLIPESVELVDGGIVTTKEQSMAAGDKFRTADVDLVILQLLTYATSYNMLPAVRDLDVPVVLVNVQKMRGVAVLCVGEDLDVLLALCDRILVLCDGKVTGIVDARTTTKEEVGLLMTHTGKGGAH